MRVIWKLEKIMNSKLLGIIVAILMILAGTIESSKDKQIEREAYCSNVALWDYDTSHGVEPLNRKGHPNYENRDCYDDEFEDELRNL
jgi:hypothetical protein